MKMILWLNNKISTNEHSRNDYCCEKMKLVMESNDFDLFYDCKMAQTYCRRRNEEMFWYWDYCPFCGKFIKSKDKEYESVLKNEFGINEPYNEENESRLPEEFKTDEWWRKRGL